MQLNHDIKDSICAIFIEGDINHNQAPEMKNYFKPLLSDKQISAIVIDFEKVDYIDSSGLGLITYFYKYMVRRNAKLAICHLNQKNKELFKMCRLDDIMSVYLTVDDAIKELGK